VASTATNWYGHEGSVLRFVFWHSLILAVLVGILVLLQAYVFPFSLLEHVLRAGFAGLEGLLTSLFWVLERKLKLDR